MHNPKNASSYGTETRYSLAGSETDGVITTDPVMGPSSRQTVLVPCRAEVVHNRPGTLERSVNVPGVAPPLRAKLGTARPKSSTSPIYIMDAEFVFTLLKLTL